MASTTSTRAPLPILGIDHLKIPTSSLTAKLAFYTTILPFKHLPHFDHRHPASPSSDASSTPGKGELFAVILQHAPTGLLLELRHHPTQAAAQRGWDAVTWSVATRADLEAWRTALVERGVECRWVLVAEDPDGAFVRWYCKETHEWDENVDTDQRWLPWL
ncbi:hypothetical protein B0H10DRAFT_2444888 [Mycena sp. CBHHK59/15]|nr:hypothetical protein B0H10DRAFT_2444888 [Mycena sp. CBHHK59/15]